MSKNGGIIGVSDHGGWAVLVTVAGGPPLRGFEAVKKPRLKIVTRSAAKNFAFRWPTNDVCGVGIHFGSPGKRAGIHLVGFSQLRFS
jgi:hypothetical protein